MPFSRKPGHDEKEGKYRASALIRAYRVEFLDEQDAILLKGILPNKKIDTRSTYLYDYLFTGIQMPITLQWEEDLFSNEEPKKGYRVNVFKYEVGADGKPVKTDKQDCRPWAFSIGEFPAKHRYTAEETE